MASVDILYIDITRRWAGMVPDSREAGKWSLSQMTVGRVLLDNAHPLAKSAPLTQSYHYLEGQDVAVQINTTGGDNLRHLSDH